MSLLSVHDLVVRFRTREETVNAVNGVSFQLDRGERVGLVGESGCGKSVTSLAIMRLLPQPAGHLEGGTILFGDLDLAKATESQMRELRGRDIAMIFQDPMTSLNPVLTIGEQMVETIRAHRNVAESAARQRAIELLATVGIAQPDARLGEYPHRFSGGMRQRVMIAMALALEPKLLIADEPTTALDVTIQAQVLDLLQTLTTEHNTALVLITHDLGVVAGMTERVNVMYAGFVVETASTLELFDAPTHPYTVGLLHSIPRIGAPTRQELVAIEGRPPDMRRATRGCPFAPRCAWRREICWTVNPPLRPSNARLDTSTAVAKDVHLVACHNPALPRERDAGRPLADRYRPAPPPPHILDELSAVEREAADVDVGQPNEPLYEGDWPGELVPLANAAGLPLDEPQLVVDEDTGGDR